MRQKAVHLLNLANRAEEELQFIGVERRNLLAHIEQQISNLQLNEESVEEMTGYQRGILAMKLNKKDNYLQTISLIQTVLFWEMVKILLLTLNLIWPADPPLVLHHVLQQLKYSWTGVSPSVNRVYSTYKREDKCKYL